MTYSGKAIQVKPLEAGAVELCFDLQGASVNKFNRLTLDELKEATAAIAADRSITAVMVTSAKSEFIVGVDITVFGENFKLSEQEFAEDLLEINKTVFNAFEDLALPTVAAVNGLALGGGMEMALAADYRVMSVDAKIGLPETSLGIMPGYGGTVRLSRLIGVDNAIEWITSGKQQKSEASLKAGAVDAVVEPEQLRQAALSLLQQCLAGKLDFRHKRQEKLDPLKLNDIESGMAFGAAKMMVAAQAGRHYPAPLLAVETIEQGAKLERDQALQLEASANAKLTKTLVAKNLVGLFLGDQALSKTAKTWAKVAAPIGQSAVLGAGIMGGGIAYQSALKGIPIIMKDIAQSGIDLGLSEASKLLSSQVTRGRLTPERMAQVLNMIQPSLSFDGFDKVDIVVEAVVENLKVKHVVLSEAEMQLNDSAVLTSNTSTISITQLAEPLRHPERFCGMHFFNPVHQMQLVEVIRGEKTNDETVAKVVSYVLALGKKAVVVNDCPGFLVNRILAPYFYALLGLVKRGVDFTRVDKVMEQFGWPMGPAKLCDVIGLDTLKHSEKALAEGYPDRMSLDFTSSHDALIAAGRLGQKSGCGYYSYEVTKRGRMKKVVDPTVAELLAPHTDSPLEITEDEIIEQMMLPLCLEAVRCLEDGIVPSASEIDMALIYGVGFPAFRGGALRYIDDMGLGECVRKSDQYRELGGLYSVPDQLRQMAVRGDGFYD